MSKAKINPALTLGDSHYLIKSPNSVLSSENKLDTNTKIDTIPTYLLDSSREIINTLSSLPSKTEHQKKIQNTTQNLNLLVAFSNALAIVLPKNKVSEFIADKTSRSSWFLNDLNNGIEFAKKNMKLAAYSNFASLLAVILPTDRVFSSRRIPKVLSNLEHTLSHINFDDLQSLAQEIDTNKRDIEIETEHHQEQLDNKNLKFYAQKIIDIFTSLPKDIKINLEKITGEKDVRQLSIKERPREYFMAAFEALTDPNKKRLAVGGSISSVLGSVLTMFSGNKASKFLTNLSYNLTLVDELHPKNLKEGRIFYWLNGFFNSISNMADTFDLNNIRRFSDSLSFIANNKVIELDELNPVKKHKIRKPWQDFQGFLKDANIKFKINLLSTESNS